MDFHQCRAAIQGAATTLALADAVKAIYQGVLSNRINEVEAETLQTLANDRRMVLKSPLAGSKPSLTARPTIFPPKRPTPRYDRSAARQRRRGHSRDRWMPDHLADHFTDGELAALSVIAQEHQKHGRCGLTIGAIAAFSGVCERTVRYALRAAEDLGLITVERIRPQGQKNLPNAISIVSREWAKWIERRPASWKGRIGCKKMQSSPQGKESSPLPPSSRSPSDPPQRLPEGRTGARTARF